jgi:hypothetical protein
MIPDQPDGRERTILKNAQKGIVNHLEAMGLGIQ